MLQLVVCGALYFAAHFGVEPDKWFAIQEPVLELGACANVNTAAQVELDFVLVNRGRSLCQIRKLPWEKVTKDNLVVCNGDKVLHDYDIAILLSNYTTMELSPGDALQGRIVLTNLPTGRLDVIGLLPCAYWAEMPTYQANGNALPEQVTPGRVEWVVLPMEPTIVTIVAPRQRQCE